MLGRSAPFALAAVLFTGCSLLSGRCLYELRGVNASGAVSISATDSATAYLVVSEQRDYQPDKDMSWQVHANSLKAQVSSVTLVDDKGATKFTFPLQVGANPALTSGFVRQSEGASLNGLFDVLSTRLAKVVITLNNGTSVTIPLQNIMRNDWNRPYCS